MSDRVNRPLNNIINKFDKPYIVIDKLDQTKVSELFSLSENMDTYNLKNFSAIHKIPLSVSDDNGNNLIHKILQSENKLKGEILRLNVIKFLISQGVNPDTPNSNNNTPLHIACEKQYCEIISYLLKIGVNPNFQDNTNMTPLHYLLNGKIDLCKSNKIIKNFVSYKKLSNIEIKKNIVMVKKKIWEKIKDNELIKSLDRTIFSTEDNEEFNKILNNFQNNYTKKMIEIDTNADKSQIITQLIEPAKSELRKYITNKFRNFENSPDIDIHTKTPNSWTNTNSTELATMKKSNNKETIKTLMEVCINELKKLINPTFRGGNGTDSDSQNGNQNSSDNLNSPQESVEAEAEPESGDSVVVVNGSLSSSSIAPSIVASNNTNQNKNQDPYITDNTYDENDDIIDWNNLTFAKGPNNYNYKINDNLSSYSEKFDSEKKLIEKLIDILVVNLEDKLKIKIKNIIIQHIELPKDIPLFDENLDENDIEKRLLLDKATWLHGFINSRRLNIENTSLFLIAGLANYKTDLKLSIHQAFKIHDFKKIMTFNENNSGSIENDYKLDFLKWIYFLLSNKHSNEIENNLKVPNYSFFNDALVENEKLWLLIDLIKRLLNKQPFNKKDYMWIPSVSMNIKNSDSEKLIDGIITYWKSMEQPPLLQHVVDTISLIREYFMNPEDRYIEKIYKRIINYYDYKKIFKSLESKRYRDESMEKQILKNINYHTLPSHIGYYIERKYNGENFINDLQKQKQEQKQEQEQEQEIRVEQYSQKDENEIMEEGVESFESKSFEEDNKPSSQTNNIDQDSKYFLKSLYLGLNYLGKIPVQNGSVNGSVNNSDSEMGDTRKSSTNGSVDIVDTQQNSANGSENGTNIITGGGNVDQQLYKNLITENITRIKNIEKMLFAFLSNLINELPKGGKNYSKIMRIYYPSIFKIESLLKFYTKIIDPEENSYETAQLKKSENRNRNIIVQINKLNAYYYLYYYLKTPKNKKIKMPKFFYYQFPYEGNKGFLAFDDGNDLLFPPQNISGSDGNRSTIPPKIVGRYNFLNTFGYNDIIDQMNNQDYFVNSKYEPKLSIDKMTDLDYTIKEIEKIDYLQNIGQNNEQVEQFEDKSYISQNDVKSNSDISVLSEGNLKKLTVEKNYSIKKMKTDTEKELRLRDIEQNIKTYEEYLKKLNKLKSEVMSEGDYRYFYDEIERLETSLKKLYSEKRMIEADEVVAEVTYTAAAAEETADEYLKQFIEELENRFSKSLLASIEVNIRESEKSLEQLRKLNPTEENKDLINKQIKDLQLGSVKLIQDKLKLENKLKKEGKLKGGALVRGRDDSLPEPIFSIFLDFYHMNVKNIIKQYSTPENRNEFENLINKLNVKLSINNKEIQKEYHLALTIQELIKEYLKNRINLFVSNKFNKIVAGREETDVDFINAIYAPEDFNLKLNNTDITLDELNNINSDEYLLNYYQFSKEPEKKEQYYLYSNDYTNTNLQKSFYCLTINNTAIEKMIYNRASFNLLDNEGNSPLHTLVKNYYSNSISTLKQLGIDFRIKIDTTNRFSKSLLQSMLEEYKNHSYKFLGNDMNCEEKKDKYKDILEFFTRNQYKEIENMIFANEKFGNNLMQNLDLSYSMALYFIQKYLSINLLNFSEDYKQDNLTEFLKSNKINTLQIPEILNNNYYSNIKNGNIKLAQNDSKLIAKKLINKITSKIGKLTNNDLYTKKIIELAELVKETNITLNFSAFKNYIEPNSDEKTLEITKLLELTKLINNGSFMNFDDTNPNGNFNIPEVIKSFDNLLIRGMNSNRGVYLDGFNQYFDDYLSKFDVLMIKTLKDNEIKKLNSNNIDQKFIENLNNLHPVYNNLSSMAKSYFESEKYLDSNKMLKYIKDVLVHLTQNIICYNIEMIMRKVLFNHFKNNDDKLDIINRNIEFIFNFDKMLENEYSNMKDILYKVVAEKLVTNSVNVFKNEDDQDTYDNQTTDEILENYFNLLTISNVFPISNDSQVMKILKDEVTSYFNTITNKIIENWMIVIENQLRFIINQERIIKCIIKMTY